MTQRALGLLVLVCAGAPDAEGARPFGLRAGIGLAVFAAPAYPGARRERLFVYPFPYVRDRSPAFRLTRDRLRARLPETPFRIGLTANGSPPAPADTPGRLGMPALAPTAALGPDLLARLPGRPGGGRAFVGVEARERIAWGPGGRLAPVGAGASAFGEWQSPREGDWRVVAGFGPVWRSAGADRYFWGVGQAFATPARPAYSPGGGYAGLRLTAAASRPIGGALRCVLFGRLRDYHGAVFAQSPLLTDRDTVLIGVALVWILVRRGLTTDHKNITRY